MTRVQDRESPLASPAIGTARNDLIRPCTTILHATPPLKVAKGIPLALSFSGGGFRATLAALGVLRFVADVGLLDQVRYVSSVSGGSLANGLFARYYEGVQAAGFSREALDEIVIYPFVRQISTASLTGVLLRNLWRTVGSKTRTDLLADTFDDWFFGGHRLEDLPAECRFIINAASVTTGVRFAFEREIVGDWVMGRTRTKGSGLRLATAAAASAAVPGAFPPMRVEGMEFPCANGRTQFVVDGGAYDNSGIEALDHVTDALIVNLNAGGIFHTGGYRGLPLVRDLQRANALLYRQSTALRFRDMVARFQSYERALAEGREPPPEARRGVLFGLASTVDDAPREWTEGRDEDRDSVSLLAAHKTSFDQFSRAICDKLIYRGWWLTGATLSAYHRDQLPEPLPRWRSLP
jgi:NTE family protein